MPDSRVPSLRVQAGALMRHLRGPVSVAAVARRLGVSRQTVMKIEDGAVSLDRLDALASQYGVQFQLLALGPDGEVTDMVPAPGLADLLTPTAES